jgi:hypothetical protein
MKTSLDYRKDSLCVLSQYEVLHADTHALVREWRPVRGADEVEVRTLLGRPVTEANSAEGLYVDEEGNVFPLAEKGATKPIDVERSFAEPKAAGNGHDEVPPSDNLQAGAINTSKGAASENQRGKGGKESRPKTKRKVRLLGRRSLDGAGAHTDAGAQPERGILDPGPVSFQHLNLRQKLAMVRRRISYVQQRGHNPRFNYNYVTAADIAGAVGDILAELGVVMVPQLESISHEPARPSGGGTEHVTCERSRREWQDVSVMAEAIEQGGSFSSPNTLTHSENVRLVVMMVERRS